MRGEGVFIHGLAAGNRPEVREADFQLNGLSLDIQSSHSHRHLAGQFLGPRGKGFRIVNVGSPA